MMTDPAPVTFVDLMTLNTWTEDGKDEQFVSLRPAFTGGNALAYGGHVYAQAVWAASLGVKEGMVVHNVHGYFTLGGLLDRPYIYTVTNISDGRSYCTRSIIVRQPVSSTLTLPSGIFDIKQSSRQLGKICFACLVSFKRDEPWGIGHQAKIDLEKTYDVVIKGKNPSEHRICPHIDFPWYHKHRDLYGQVNDFPGLDMRKVDMCLYNASKSATDYRQLIYYRTIGEIPSDKLNLHACAHLYASDRNGMYLIGNALKYGDQTNIMGSLSHSVVFHVSSKELIMKKEEWWCQESWSARSEGGRGMVESRIINKNGEHVATTWQDGVARKAQRPEDEKLKINWYEQMEKRGKLPKGAGSKSKL